MSKEQYINKEDDTISTGTGFSGFDFGHKVIFSRDKDGVVYVTSIYKSSAKLNQHFEIRNRLPDECVSALIDWLEQ